MRYDFGSDNTAGMAPEALAGIQAANTGFARAYGADDVTGRAADLIRQRLDADAEVRFVFSGTAANAIALSMLTFPFEAVLAHHAAHVCTDETGAPGFFGQGVGLIGLPGFSGKIDPKAMTAILDEPEVGHRQPPAALSLTQATEYGSVYTTEELRHLIEPAKARGYGVHMDGARLANAAAAGFDLTQIARLGVDVLVFGGAKAGAPSDWRGRRLAEGVAANSRFVLAHPVEANAVFVRMPAAAHRRLNEAGWACYRFDDGSVRFVCSWATREDAVDELVAAVAALT